MRKSRFSEEQIIGLLKGRKVADVCREHGISEATFYRWKSKYSGLEVSDAKKLRKLEDENRRLKQLDNQALKAALGKKW
jgi:putative transposase